MRYLLLIYHDEASWARRTEEEAATVLDPWWAYDDAVTASGVSQGATRFPRCS